MMDLSGPVAPVSLTVALGLAVASSLLAAILGAWRAPARRGLDLAVAALLGASAMAVASTWGAFPQGVARTVVLQHVASFLRIGQMEVHLDLSAGPLGVTLASAVAVSAAVALVSTGGASRALRVTLPLATTLGQIAVLADDLGTTAVAWVALALVLTWSSPRALGVATAASGLLLAGAAVLFWGAGGVFADGDYVPDLSPRIAAVRVSPEGGAQVTKATGQVAFTALPGARLHLDESRVPVPRSGASGSVTPEEAMLPPLEAPFVGVPVSAGVHTFRVHAGGGLDDYVAAHVPVGEGQDVALVLFGSTLSLRTMADAMAVTPRRGLAPREVLAGRSLMGVRVVGLAWAAFLGAALAFATAVVMGVRRDQGRGLRAAAPALAFAAVVALLTRALPLRALGVEGAHDGLGLLLAAMLMGAGLLAPWARVFPRAAWQIDRLILDGVAEGLAAALGALLRRKAIVVAGVLLFVGVGMAAGVLPELAARADGTAPKVALTVDVVSPSGAPAGVVPLVPFEGSYVGQFALRNNGTTPVAISRVSLRGDREDPPRLPPKVTAQLEGGRSEGTLAPGETRIVRIAWMPDLTTRQVQLQGHVILTLGGAATGAAGGERAVAFEARARGTSPLGAHLLSMLVLAPGLLVLAALAFHVARRRDTRPLRAVALGATLLQGVLAVALLVLVRADVSRIDGNDGYQLQETVGLGGWALTLGVDATSIPFVATSVLVGVAAVFASLGVSRTAGYWAYLGALGSALTIAFLAVDLGVLVAALALVVLFLGRVLAVHGGAGARRGAFKVWLLGLLGVALLAGAAGLLREASAPVYLADGAPSAHTLLIPELARQGLGRSGALVFGIPRVVVTVSLGAAGVLLLLGAFPAHTWVVEAMAEAPVGVALLVVTGLTRVGAYVLLRLTAILPEGAVWGAGTLTALGVLGLVHGSLCALAEPDLRRTAGYLSVAQVGIALLGLSSATPQGLAGGVLTLLGSSLATGALLVVVAALEARVGTRDVRRFGGLLRDMPQGATVAVAATLGVAAAPVSVTSWGLVASALGAFPLEPAAATVALVSWGLLVVAATTLPRRLFTGAFDEAWRRDPHLEPFGGAFPELTAAERTAAASLAVLGLALGCAPGLALRYVSPGARDVAAAIRPPGPDQIAHATAGGARVAVTP